MQVRQLFDQDTFTFTYLLIDEPTRQAVIIDPVREQLERDLALIAELGLTLRYVLETHVHADHVTSAAQLAERTGAVTGASTLGATCASRHLKDGDTISFGSSNLRVLETPGHTRDSLSFVAEGHVFTGDALFVRGTGRTDFQNGSADALYDSITQKLFVLPEQTLVWPGHDYRGHAVSTIGEERQHNPRLAGKSREQFATIMRELKLSPPKRIQVAVPANLACGREPTPNAQSAQG
jgi:sulfur dioxygenase